MPSISQLYNLSQAYIYDQLEPMPDEEEDEEGEEGEEGEIVKENIEEKEAMEVESEYDSDGNKKPKMKNI